MNTGQSNGASRLTHDEWKTLRDLVADDHAQYAGPAPTELLKKLDWHIEDTFDLPNDYEPREGRP